MRHLPLFTWLLAVAGCGFVDAPGTPRVVAHRFGSSLVPQNSRAGVKAAIVAGYQGFEFDLNVTKDNIPIVNHDAWVNQTQCTRADGSALPQGVKERLLIKDLTAAELRSGFLCGGVKDPEFPDMALIPEPLMTLDELLTELATMPPEQAQRTFLQFDIKYEPGLTLGPDVYANEILSRVAAAKLTEPWYASCFEADLVRAFRAWGAANQLDVKAVLTFPLFRTDDNTTLGAIGYEVLSNLGVSDPIGAARAANATGVELPYQIAQRPLVEDMKKEGLSVGIFTVDDEAPFQAFCRWPIDVLITDFASRLSCK